MLKKYSEGELGGKATDLENYAGVLTEAGFSLLRGWVIRTEIFMQMENLLYGKSQDCTESDIQAAASLKGILRQIIGEMTVNIPYAVRSSAISERGGTGIYQSDFFVPQGDVEKDLEILFKKVIKIYQGEFSDKAFAWREKVNLPAGMAILIQPVAGSELTRGYWLPSLSGIAYTSFNGLPLVQCVIGLGTKAVLGGGVKLRGVIDEPLEFHRALWDQNMSDAIFLGTGEIVEIRFTREDVFCSTNHSVFGSLFEKLEKLKTHGDFYLEWAIVGQEVFVVQCAPYEDKMPGQLDFDNDKYLLLAEGSDTHNSGVAKCAGIVFVNSWSKSAARLLQKLNTTMSGFLLIFQQNANSLVSILQVGVQLEYQHFSNARALVEVQFHWSEKDMDMALMAGVRIADHTEGHGGASHFKQLCSRSDILFLGAEFDDNSILSLPGKIDYFGNREIFFWDRKAIVSVDGVNKKGYAYVAKEGKTATYSPQQIVDFSMALRWTASGLEEKKDRLSSAFYHIHYVLDPEDNPIGFDPFALNENMVEEIGEEGIIRDLQVVISNLHLVTAGPGTRLDKMAMEKYLNELKQKLEG